jgi:hypothetical protein
MLLSWAAVVTVPPEEDLGPAWDDDACWEEDIIEKIFYPVLSGSQRM